MNCVVCHAEVERETSHFANAWERSRKRYPCCSVACAQRFDADVHWIPDPLPEPASALDQDRLLKVVRARLRDGDRPIVILREMLLAGVDPHALRRALFGEQVQETKGRALARDLNRTSLLAGLFTGQFSLFASRRKSEAAALEAAMKVLDSWDERLRRMPSSSRSTS